MLGSNALVCDQQTAGGKQPYFSLCLCPATLKAHQGKQSAGMESLSLSYSVGYDEGI